MGSKGQGQQQQAHKGKSDKAKLKTWLKAKGHDAKAVDAARMDTDDDMRAMILQLHGVTEIEYERAKRGPNRLLEVGFYKGKSHF